MKVSLALLKLRYKFFPPKSYVVVYDRCTDLMKGEYVEEYYGYFSSPEEAFALFDEYQSGIAMIRNVKLCLIVGSWDFGG